MNALPVIGTREFTLVRFGDNFYLMLTGEFSYDSRLCLQWVGEDHWIIRPLNAVPGITGVTPATPIVDFKSPAVAYRTSIA